MLDRTHIRPLAVSADACAHHFRMMKELALLGYFTSEIDCWAAHA
jgi:hypothetical protein